MKDFGGRSKNGDGLAPLTYQDIRSILATSATWGTSCELIPLAMGWSRRAWP